MTSITSFLWSFVGVTTSKRATPTLISKIIDKAPVASTHDRSSYSAPPLRSPQLAFKSELFIDHPTRYVSFSELIRGLTPPTEIQVQELESIEAEGTIISILPAQDEIERRLLQSLALNSALTSLLREPNLPTHVATPNELPLFNNRNRRGPSLEQIKEVKLEHANSPIDKRNFLVHEAYDRYFMALNGMYFKEYRHLY